ncbi:MAG: hypothetical protein H6831_09480 [Planctomycetes bacterium]|nr:hypothetical protein [Planctomycetota bacterium]MCB9904625.1 hypothetical protein [Planctomycetota bacterium]
MPECPACHAPLETPLACGACGALIEVEGESDPFALFGLARGWELDAGELKKRLLRFGRMMHPDFYAAAGDAARELAERNTAALNEAHDVLANDFRRADWLVRALGGPTESDERQMPQAFLMDVLDWNETLDDARGAAPGSAEIRALDELGETLSSERGEAFVRIGALLTPLPDPGSDALGRLRRELNAVRYLDRALRELKSLRLQHASTR